MLLLFFILTNKYYNESLDGWSGITLMIPLVSVLLVHSRGIIFDPHAAGNS